MVRTNQGGSVLSFIVIGIVTILLLIGGVYAIRHQQSTQPQPTPPSSQEKNEPQQTNKQPSAKEQTQQKSPSQSETSSPTQSPSPSSQANSAQPNDQKQLPQTGPSEMTGTILIVSLISAAVIYYIRSRRAWLSL